MDKDDLINLIANKVGISKRLARGLLTELIKTAIAELKRGHVFVFPGLGRMFTSRRMARSGRNIQTEAPTKIPRETVVRFRVDKKVVEDLIAEEEIEKDTKMSQLWEIMQAGTLGMGGAMGAVSSLAWSRLFTDFLETPVSSVVRIFYATDREPNPQMPSRFGSRRSSTGLHFGTCDVSIPRDHRMANIERPSILRWEFSESPAKHFVIKEITEKECDEFYSQLSQRVQHSEGKEALVFIHGFRVSFADAVYRTAQIAYDLAFTGAPILYSWPSNGKLYEYIGDINNNDWTTDHLKAFLQELATRSGAKIIHLIAHSMGNRALINALNMIVQSAVAPKLHFSQLILTAPDIDADLFIRIAELIRTTAERITLYASNHDKALAASKKLNGSYPRAGDASQSVVVVQGVDTIDASAVDTNLIGHFYYAENRSVLSDIFNLLRDGSPPEKRFGIRPVATVPASWRFAP
jgi:esterase/lipase superfamily enzyme/nucleoid DNA-binding protein